jgi:hypothetical protein
MSPLTAPDVSRGVIRLLRDMGFACLTEFSLNNNRRADVAGLDDKGRFVLVEIKVSVADFRGDQKWPEYLGHADLFYFAVPEDFPHSLVSDALEAHAPHAGLMLSNGFEAAVLREAQVQPIAAARRKAETLRFARLAASRLHWLRDDALAMGEK